MTRMGLLAMGAILWAGAGLAGALPAGLVKQVRSAPDGFAKMATGVILGYGGAQGLRTEGVARLIAVEKGRRRAREMARLLPADLDGDTRVTQEELLAVAATQGLSARAALDLAFRAADADGDAVATLAEVHASAEVRAAAGVAKERARAEEILACDRDGDGAVTIDEVLAVIAEVRAQG